MYRRMALFIAVAALIAIITGCTADNPTEPMTQTLMRPTVPMQAPAIGDLVWYDANMDGIQGDMETEPGIEGVTVHLFDCVDSTMVAEDTTDAMGLYSFEDLPPGDYYLHFVLPDGYFFSPMNMTDDSLDSDADTLTGFTDCVSVDSTEADYGWDAGMYTFEPVGATVGDRAWYDINMNGLQDTAEYGFEGVMVHLYDCEDTIPIAETVTDAGGHYWFMDLVPGYYQLRFVPPDGYAFSPKDEGIDDAYDSDAFDNGYTMCFTLDSAQVDITWDAGLMLVDSGCTRSKGYWKNHAGFGPQDDMVTDLLPIRLGNEGDDKSLAVTDAQIAVDVLHQHTYGHPSNGITKLYAQLLAAKLNIANGAAAVDIGDVIAEADDFLAMHDWMDWENLDNSQKHEILGWKDMLDDYNNGHTGPGYCDDYDDDDDGQDDDTLNVSILPGGVTPY